MKQTIKGFSLLEVLLACLVLSIAASAAVPAAMKFYRQAAVEYEAEHLLSEIRRAQSINRLTAERAYQYGAKSPMNGSVYLRVQPTKSQIWIGRNAEFGKSKLHQLLPLVRIANESKSDNDSNKGNLWKLTFDDDSVQSHSLMTLLIYAEGHKEDGRKLVISRGRVRMERRAD